MIGIIGAMEEEVDGLKKLMTDVEVSKKAGMDFLKGKLHNKAVVIVKCGVGKVNAAMCTQILIDVFSVDGIINTGIAGSLDAEINIGDIVLGKDVLEHDMDVAALGYGPGMIPDMEDSIFRTDEKLFHTAKKAVESAGLDVKVYAGRIVSGDQFISSGEKKDWLVTTFDGKCAEMEGAAIGHVAYLNKVPFLVVRAISDKADDSAHMDYPAFEKLASRNSIKFMEEFIKLSE